MNATVFISDPKVAEPPSAKETWIQKYAVRILIRFQQCQTPRGVANTCITRLKKDLEMFYDDPVKRFFVEVSF